MVNYLKTGHYFIPDLDGGIQLNESALKTYRAAAKEPLPILFQSGYLTIKEYDNTYRMYRLGYPNDEVRYDFLENLLPAYTPFNRSEALFSVVEFTKTIQAGNVDDFMTRMQSMISSIPYDNFSEKDLKLREQNYQTAVYLVFALM